ncbi:MAG: cobalamin-dependent protein, partial [Bdellovibrio sp.]
MKTDILLVTLNSTYQHSSFGLRYLYSNLKELQAHAQILEFTTAKEPRDIAEQLLKLKPKVIGLGVYIWNSQESYELVSLLKRISPETLVVLGGPEVTHESETQPICQVADFTIKGEADFLFYDFCKSYLTAGILPEHKFV